MSEGQKFALSSLSPLVQYEPLGILATYGTDEVVTNCTVEQWFWRLNLGEFDFEDKVILDIICL